ncbi:hypothetical protein L514_3652 [Bordetella bronchiseptica MBORD635]|nr:hypothetical protein L514_3652 [Bordetella bronchiseptica MBORD635]
MRIQRKCMNGIWEQILQMMIHQPMAGNRRQTCETGGYDVHPKVPRAAFCAFVPGVQVRLVLYLQDNRI